MKPFCNKVSTELHFYFVRNIYKHITHNNTCNNTLVLNMKIKTKIWKRGQNSFATTIPQNILLLRNIDTSKPVNVLWSIDLKTGKFTVEFEEVTE